MILSEPDILQCLMRWRTRVSAAAWLVVRDAHASEDIFQNVALKAMTRGASFDSEGALLSWALITARREGIDWLRRQGREVFCCDEEIRELLDREWQLESRPATAASRIDALQECLASAPESARHLLRLRYHDGLSCEEVAQHMGIGLNAIYKRISRLHEDLRHCIEGKLSTNGMTGANPP